MSDPRLKQAVLAAWLGIIGMVLLVIMKAVVGMLSHSMALIADAAYSASVVSGTFAVRMAGAAKDSPHAVPSSKTMKAETVTGILVAVLLFVVGGEIGIAAVKSIVQGVESPPKDYAVLAIVISLLAKEVLFRYKYTIGKKIANPQLMASAWEHRTDMYPSFVALIGVIVALIGKSLGLKTLYIIDAIAAFFIALLFFKLAYKLVLDTIHSSMEHVINGEAAAELIGTVQKIKGIITVDELRARGRGHYVLVDVKISVNPKITVHEGHEIARLIKQQLMKRFTHISDVNIQVNPYDPGYPYKNNVDPDQDETVTILH